MKQILSSWVVLFLISKLRGADRTLLPRPGRKPLRQSVAAELQEFKDALAAQQKQIEALQRDNQMLKDGMRKRDAALDQAQAAVSAAQTKADQAWRRPASNNSSNRR